MFVKAVVVVDVVDVEEEEVGGRVVGGVGGAG